MQRILTRLDLVSALATDLREKVQAGKVSEVGVDLEINRMIRSLKDCKVALQDIFFEQAGAG